MNLKCNEAGPQKSWSWRVIWRHNIITSCIFHWCLKAVEVGYRLSKDSVLSKCALCSFVKKKKGIRGMNQCCWSGIRVQWLCNFRFLSTRYENKRLNVWVCFACPGRPVFMSVHPDGAETARHIQSVLQIRHTSCCGHINTGQRNKIKNEPVPWWVRYCVLLWNQRSCLPKPDLHFKPLVRLDLTAAAVQSGRLGDS